MSDQQVYECCIFMVKQLEGLRIIFHVFYELWRIETFFEIKFIKNELKVLRATDHHHLNI